MTQKSRQKFEYLENKKSFQGEIKSVFHHFPRVFSCQRLSQTSALFINFSVLATMLPIMAKLNVILGSECVNT